MKIFRQGDVLIREVATLPEGNLTPHTDKLTIALGEATGHHHTFYPAAPQAQIADIVINGKRFVKLDTDWLLRHQEHDEIRIPPGVYEIGNEREYNPFEQAMKKVVD